MPRWVIALLAGVLLGGVAGYGMAGRRAVPRETDVVEALHALGLPDRAHAPWQALHEQDPDDPVARAGLALVYFRDGQRLGRKGDWPGAIRAFGEAVRLEPGVFYFHLGQGHAYVSDSRFEQGLAAFDEALRLEPTSVSASLSAFHARLELGKPRAAKADLERLEELARSKPDIAQALPGLYEKLGLAFEESGALEEAKAARERAATLRGG